MKSRSIESWRRAHGDLAETPMARERGSHCHADGEGLNERCARPATGALHRDSALLARNRSELNGGSSAHSDERAKPTGYVTAHTRIEKW